jgi:outer membrane protein insertion porin family
LGLVLGVPLLSQPLQAQPSEPVGDLAPDETNVEMVDIQPGEMEAPAVEMVQVEQPRVLISEVTN